jgi:hypothetical protein
MKKEPYVSLLLPDNPIPEQLRLAKLMIGLVADGDTDLVCTLISGPAGIGKTFTAETALSERVAPWQKVNGTGAGLMMALYRMRRGGTILLDDADSLIFGGGIQQTNRMKEITEPVRQRTINNATKESMKLAAGATGNSMIGVLPPRFTIRAGIVVILNQDIDTMSTKQRAMIDPLISRGLEPIRISCEPQHVLNYVLHMIVSGRIKLKAGGHELNAIEANDVVEWFSANALRHENISLRTIKNVAILRRRHPDDWRALANAKLRPKPVEAAFYPSDLNIGRPFNETRALERLKAKAEAAKSPLLTVGVCQDASGAIAAGPVEAAPLPVEVPIAKVLRGPKSERKPDTQSTDFSTVAAHAFSTTLLHTLATSKEPMDVAIAVPPSSSPLEQSQGPSRGRNGNSRFFTLQPGRHSTSGSRKPNDFYETPFSITRQLLELGFLRSAETTLEPACGNGAIMKVLDQEGFRRVVAYDIEKDFLRETRKFDQIVTNPPFSLAMEFIRKAKEVARHRFAMLLPLNYLHGKARHDLIYQDTVFPLASVNIFTRYPMFGDLLREDGRYRSGMMICAWYCWDREHVGAPTMSWINNDQYLLTATQRAQDITTKAAA